MSAVVTHAPAPAALGSRGRLRGAMAGAACCAALLTVTATASASTVATQEAGTVIAWSAAAGEVNQISFNDQGNFTIQDLNGTSLTAQPPCASAGGAMVIGTLATCPSSGVRRVDVMLGDENDTFFAGGISNVLVALELDGGLGNDDLTGGRVGDRLTGGLGQDRLAGGDGADIIDAFDGATVDTVVCGSGIDTAYADAGDDVAPDCETVIQSAAPAPVRCPADQFGTPPACFAPVPPACPVGLVGSPPNCSLPPVVRQTQVVRLLLRSSRRLRVDDRGRVSPGSASCTKSADCYALQLALQSRPPTGAAAVRYANSTLAVASGGRERLVLKLRRAALRTLRRRGSLSATLRVDRGRGTPLIRRITLLAAVARKG